MNGALLILFCSALVVMWSSVKSRAIKYISASVILAFVFLLFGAPLLIRTLGPPALGRGSYKHARLWRDKLAACDSLDAVRQQFNCGRFQGTPGGSYRYVGDPNTHREGNTWALLYEFPDGKWLAMAYASSHNTWGGGTVVTRDQTGRIRVFFGHVCGRPYVESESLDEVYACLSDPAWEEVSL